MSHFESEIHEQPEVLARIARSDGVRRVAADLAAHEVRLVLTLARGSSDNALTFFSYLAGRYLGLPVASLPPSLFTVYGATLNPDGALAIGVSQSGESSDVIEGLGALRREGALTLAVTNEQGSAIEEVAHHTLLQDAGPERAVAASKTFSSQLMVLACLVAHWSGDRDLQRALADVPDRVRTLLERPTPLKDAALRLTHAGGLYVLGRGLTYAPALETALKLKETSYLHAQAYSSAEFQHGPIAAVDANDPLLLLAGDDGTLASNRIVAERLRDMGADLTVVSGTPELLALANAAVPLPEGVHPVTSAFLQVVAGQLLALYLTTSKGLDPDRPRHLKKVTKTL